MHLHRDVEHETRPAFRSVLGGDGALMGPDDEAAEIQAQTGPSASRSRRWPVWLEQCFQGSRVQASAFVFHGHN